MFKLESYITPILLSYVDKYIKNFRLEDSTVSLWGGDACFHNLDLRLEVLEQELHLPVSFVSGHIRELLIHVPWTKLASEPITITINTIECILKLRGSDGSSTSSSSGKPKEKWKSDCQDLEAPPGYLTSLIHKIVGNIRIYCNNLILKYVEEDIVLSMNIKHFKFESANELWEPAFTDLASDEIKMRKLICINDLTICLDKRNAAGKIEVYQEPMLYKCSMTMHLLRMYHSATASRSSRTRLDIYCNSLEFGMSEQQLPMFIRLILMLYALKRRRREEAQDTTDLIGTIAEVRDMVDASHGWGGWAWSYVSSVLSDGANEEWMNQQSSEAEGHIFHMGFYIDKASVIFKVTDASRDRNYYAHKKLRYMPVLALELQGIYSETIRNGFKWLSSTFGISEILLSPLGFCCCSVLETPQGSKPIPYLTIGQQCTYYKFNSLFDADALENKGAKKFYNSCWDYHLLTTTESVLLERTPAFSVDYIHEVSIPDDFTTEKIVEMASNFEYSNLAERDFTRVFVAPMKLRVCSGLYHRMSSMVVAAMTYEYVPYYVPMPDADLKDLQPPSEEDYDALNEFIPQTSIKITFFGPVIEFETADHPKFVPKKGKLYKKHKKLSSLVQQTQSQTTMVDNDSSKIQLEFQCLDFLYTSPSYVNRLVHTTCQLPDPPKVLFDACFKKLELKIVGMTSRLLLKPKCQTTILMPFNIVFMRRQILKPQYWVNPDVTQSEITVESENLTLTGTKAKIMVACNILKCLFQIDCGESDLTYTSLLADASNDQGFPYMELYIEGIRFKTVTTCTTVSIDMSLESIKAFIFQTCKGEKHVKKNLDPIESIGFSSKDIQQILFISGPEPKRENDNNTNSSQEIPLFMLTIQYPIDPDVQVHPTIVTYNLQEIRVCVDPLVFKWFLYTPELYKKNTFSNFSDTPFKLKHVDSNVFNEPSRKTSSNIESVHSSSDRDRSSVISRKSKIPKEEPVDIHERIYTFLKDWVNVWKCMILSGEISQCTIYFPMNSLSAVGSQGIQEAVDQAIKEPDPPDIMIVTLPFLSTYCTQRQKLQKFINLLPVKLPDSIWSPEKSCFPWTLSIKDLSCYTIQNGERMDCLKPCSLNATVGLSTKNSKSEDKSCIKDNCSNYFSKEEISSLGICVHVDMTPIFISTCEEQVFLFARILYGLVEVVSGFLPTEKPKHQEYPLKILESLDSRSGTLMMHETSFEQQSEHSSSIKMPETVEQEAKLTAWLQWTITRFTIELNSMPKESKKHRPKLKLVIDTEDIVSSIDFQNVYLKIKSKVGSISVEHFKFVHKKWQSGPYLGLVMKHRDDYLSEDRQEDNAFINITITRASCQHTHTLWGTLQNKKNDKIYPHHSGAVLARYITEIVVSIKPTDFLLSFKTLRSFYLVLEPLFAIEMPTRKQKSETSLYMTNQLPLAYLECHDLRLIMPTSLPKKKCGNKARHDVYIFQLGKISLAPTAVNPICRTPYRPDIYQYAARNRILNIPGSDIEDRQYQLDICGTSLNTGTWKNVELIMKQPIGILTSLHGSSENPAVEWNNMEKVSISIINPSMQLWPVLEKIDLSIVAAPAMVYKGVLVCCNSLEVNVVSDITINLSLSQIELALCLYGELKELLQPVKSTKSKIKYPHKMDEKKEIDVEALRDSGIESSEFKSVASSHRVDTKIQDSIYRFDSEKHQTSLKMAVNVDNKYPSDFLITAGKLNFSFFDIGEQFPVYETDMNTKISNIKIPTELKQVISKFQGKKNKSQMFSNDNPNGARHSSEEMESEEDSKKNFVPLLFVSFSQPNIFYSEQQNTTIANFSLFNTSLKIGCRDNNTCNSVPTEKNYPVTLLDTLSGNPHSDTGVPPSFLTVKVTRTNHASLEVEFARPTRLNLSSGICYDILAIKKKILDCFEIGKSSEASSRLKISAMPLSLIPEISENYVKFQEMKEKIYNLNVITVKTDQLVCIWSAGNDYNLRLTVGKSAYNLNLVTRPDKICNFVSLECVSLLYEKNFTSQLVLKPWNISSDITLFWESWQYLGDDPQIQVIAESDCLFLTVCPQRIEILLTVLNNLLQFFNEFKENSNESVESLSEKVEKTTLIAHDSEQHYKDDLRAGAFQFVDSVTNNIDELPLPYQVMFWNKNVAAMAWRYPQPRCLTKVRVFPVPLKVVAGFENVSVEVSCSLEYWSDCKVCFVPYAQFILPENEIFHLDLPSDKPYPPFACVWRVEVSIKNDLDYHIDIFSVFSPRALAACLRIDSYFSKNLIPNLNVGFSVAKCKLAFHTLFDKERCKVLPKFLKGYTPDLAFPTSHCFAEFDFDNFKLNVSSWNLKEFIVDFYTPFKFSVLDYYFLTMQPVVESSSFSLKTSVGKTCNCNTISQSISINFSPSIAHTLSISTQLWHQNYLSYSSKDERELDFLIVTRFVVCNDTNVTIKFGQNNTDEEIILLPKYFHLYCWRSHKFSQKLKVSLESKEWLWSEPFSLKLGEQIVEVNKNKNISLNVKVIAISSTQYQLIFSGQLVVANLLLEHFELKVIQESKSDNKRIINQIVAGNSMTTSIIINYEKTYFLRLRFYGLDTSWTGDIPLQEHSKSVQPWLVKVPLLERGQFLSIWCRVVVQEFSNGKKILAMLWPLFSIKSNLPINTKVHIETPTLNYHGDIVVEGRGKSQQLYCPGTIDHGHQLTFQLENVTPGPSPYVPLNYSLIDHETFFKRMNKVDIQDIIDFIKSQEKLKWPYFGDELDSIEWLVEDQPETHVQVRYENSCQFSSSLMVELIPWCLMVNTLGTTIGIKVEGEEVCSLSHNGIVAPPKLEENFNIIIYSDGDKFLSDPLQFAKPANWSQNFYMPKILGIIPSEGKITSNVKCNKNICRLSIQSSMTHEMHLMKIASSHVLCNNTGLIINVKCLAVPNIDKTFSIPHYTQSGFETISPDIYEKKQGMSIKHWYNLENGIDSNIFNEYCFYMVFSVNPKIDWTAPIKVDEVFIRKTVSVMSTEGPIPLVITSNEHKGQHFVGVHHDTRPQIYIENDSGVDLYVAESKDGDEPGAIQEIEHFDWFCKIKNGDCNYYSTQGLEEKFPDIPSVSRKESLVFAKDPFGIMGGDTWSSPVNITDDLDQYIKIPFNADVRIVVHNTSCLTYVKIESVSKVEVSAKEIRARLLSFEEEVKASKSMNNDIEYQKPKNLKSVSAEAIRPYEDIDYHEITDRNISTGSIMSPKAENELGQASYQLRNGKSDLNALTTRRKPTKLLCATLPMLQDWEELKIMTYVNQFKFTLLSEIDIDKGEVDELAVLNLDNIAMSVIQSEIMDVHLCIENMQFDNQLYSKKNYDFPVVILMQESFECRKINSMNIPIENLFEEIKERAFLEVSLTIDTWLDPRHQKVSGIQDMTLSLRPFNCYLEDTYLMLFADYFKLFLTTNLAQATDSQIPSFDRSVYVTIPQIVLWQGVVPANPITIRRLVIKPVSLLLSIHSSIKMYVALDQSPLFFAEFERRRVFTNAYRLGHTLTMHYLSGAIFRAGWMVSSLEILGSPVGLARAMGSGLKDFVSMPITGLFQGPVEFLYGVSQGSASLMKHITAGTLQSFTKMASSVARNLDYLSMDEEHVKRAEEQRRLRPTGVTEGFVQGLTGLGISILGAIGGIAHHPLQSVILQGGSPRSLAVGLGLGLVGIITKPLSGAAELLALTGQGLLEGAGWTNLPERRYKSLPHLIFASANSVLKYEWKITSTNDPNGKFLHVTEATSVSPSSQFASVALILTNKHLIIMNSDDDVVQNSISLTELEPVRCGGDQNMLSFELVPNQAAILKTDDDLNIEMDPTSRARVAEFVKSTVGLLQTRNRSREPSEMSISPLSSPGGAVNAEGSESNTVLSFYVDVKDRNYFLCLLSIAKQENMSGVNSYPVL